MRSKIFIVLLALTLTACGGGSGGGASNPDAGGGLSYAWQAPLNVGRPDGMDEAGDARYLELANGHWMLVFVNDSMASPAIVSSIYDGKTWSEPTKLWNGDFIDGRIVKLARWGDGAALVNAEGGLIYWRTYHPEKGWSMRKAVMEFDGAEGAAVDTVHLVTNASNQAYLYVLGGTTEARRMILKGRFYDGGWKDEHLIQDMSDQFKAKELALSYEQSSALMLNDRGQLLVSWQEREFPPGGSSKLAKIAARSIDGHAQGDGIAFPLNDGGELFPVLSIDGEGSAYLLLSIAQEGIYGARHDAQLGWDSPSWLKELDCFATLTAAAGGQANSTVVAWSECDAESGFSAQAMHENEGEWIGKSVTNVFDGGVGVSLFVDKKDTPLAFYSEEAAESCKLAVSAYINSEWQPANDSIDCSSGDISLHYLAPAADKGVSMLWSQGGDYWAARYR